MSILTGERITFKRTRPNPLFLDWLEELHEEAKQKGSKLEPLLKEALSSLSKYPLPLQSGAECAILKGFDKRLCSFLDKRLEVHKNSSKICSSECAKTVKVVQTLYEDENDPSSIASKSPQAKKGRLRYKPAFRSGSYALLMVLIDLKDNQSMNKKQLMAAAQKYCEEDIALVWKNMTRLLARGLVKKSGSHKPQFSLTEEGFSVAKDLFRDIQSKRGVDEVVMNISQNNRLYDEENKFISDLIVINTENKTKEIDAISHNNIKPYIDTGTVILGNCNSKIIESSSVSQIEDQVVVDFSDLIEMEPGSYDIILLIDKNETSGLSKKNDPTIIEFKKYPEMSHEYRSLKVGDFAWIARNKKNGNQELVLPYVVERKRMDDLGASVKDGRFHEQKFRLRKCGLNYVIYMVENHGSNKHVGLPMQSLMQALANTRVQDGFKVHVTESLNHSVRFLAMMTWRLIIEYKNKRLRGHNREPRDEVLMTFEYFNKSCTKNKALSVTDTFIKLLLQLKGVSVEKALTITNVYKTPRSLIEAYESCDEKKGEMLLANLRFGELNRSVGQSVSKSIYQLFTLRSMK